MARHSKTSLPMKLTISRWSSHKDSVIAIRVTDEASSIEFLELHLTPHNFAECLTGLGYVRCEGTVGGLENLGKRYVWETRNIAYTGPETFDPEIQSEWLLANYKEDGWQVNPYLGAQGSRTGYGATQRLNFQVYKYVEDNTDD